MSHHTDVVLRNIARYFATTADRIERDVHAGKLNGATADYWRGSVDGLRAAAKRIREDWVAPTGRYHDTPVLRLVRTETTEETEA